MPKVYNTRKQKARELLERLERGPAFSHWREEEKKHPEQAAIDHYKNWAESWIIPVVVDLVYELRGKWPRPKELRSTKDR